MTYLAFKQILLYSLLTKEPSSFFYFKNSKEFLIGSIKLKNLEGSISPIYYRITMTSFTSIFTQLYKFQSIRHLSSNKTPSSFKNYNLLETLIQIKSRSLYNSIYKVSLIFLTTIPLIIIRPPIFQCATSLAIVQKSYLNYIIKISHPIFNISIATLYRDNTLISIFIEYSIITLLIKFLVFNSFFYKFII